MSTKKEDGISAGDVAKMIEGAGGSVKEGGLLPDGSGFMTASFPLPKTHWLYAEPANGFDAPPMPLRMGSSDPRRQKLNAMVREAARYAVRAATMRGRDEDFDPDALVQNMVVGLLGYHTADGLSGLDEWANPKPVPEGFDALLKARSA